MYRSLCLTITAFLSTANAECPASAQTLVEVEVHACRPVSIESHEMSETFGVGHQEGILITGTVNVAKSVSNFEEPTMLLKTSPIFSNGETAALFIPKSAPSACSAFSRNSREWFVSRYLCCDTLPERGLCIVPSPIVVADIETDPEIWTVYGPPYYDEN